MSIGAMTNVWSYSKAKGSTLLLLLAIADYAKDDGTDAHPSLETLATKTRMSKQNVINLIGIAENKLHELKVHRSATRGRTNVNHYDLLVDLDKKTFESRTEINRKKFLPLNEKTVKSSEENGKIPEENSKIHTTEIAKITLLDPEELRSKGIEPEEIREKNYCTQISNSDGSSSTESLEPSTPNSNVKERSLGKEPVFGSTPSSRDLVPMLTAIKYVTFQQHTCNEATIRKVAKDLLLNNFTPEQVLHHFEDKHNGTRSTYWKTDPKAILSKSPPTEWDVLKKLPVYAEMEHQSKTLVIRS